MTKQSLHKTQNGRASDITVRTALLYSDIKEKSLYVKQYRQCTYNVTLRRIHEAILAIEKYFISLCVRALAWVSA